MRLYMVTYKEWDVCFTNLHIRQALSIGNNEVEAINRAKEDADKYARDFQAQEINQVYGHEIIVK